MSDKNHVSTTLTFVASACATLACFLYATGTPVASPSSLYATTLRPAATTSGSQAAKLPTLYSRQYAQKAAAIDGRRVHTFATQPEILDTTSIAALTSKGSTSTGQISLLMASAISLSSLFAYWMGRRSVTMAATTGRTTVALNSVVTGEYLFTLGSDGQMQLQSPAPESTEPTAGAEDAEKKPKAKSEKKPKAKSAKKPKAKSEEKPKASAKEEPKASAEEKPAATAEEQPEASDKKPKKKKKKTPPPPPKPTINNASYFDIRVGKIVEVGQHPDAEALYLEKIDVGEEEPRQIVSGLVRYVPQDQMQDALVLVMCNLKPAKLRGIVSYGMVMCASETNGDERTVKLVDIPEGAQVGDRVTFPGLEGSPVPEMPKKRAEKLLPGFNTNAEGVCCWENTPLTLEAGVVSSDLKNAGLG